MESDDEFIHNYLCIDRLADGGLCWLGHPSKYQSPRVQGKAAGAVNNRGYYRTSIRGRLFLNHRIVWFIHNGKWPEGYIDHIDGDTANNNIENMRDVTPGQNSHNNLGKGYYFHKPSGKWLAQIRVDGKTKSLGYFLTVEDARSAYLKAKEMLHPTAPGRCFDYK